MIALLVSAEADLGRQIGQRLRGYGVSVVQYADPLKALDNLAETRPRILVCSWQDFPRHWKPLLQQARQELGSSLVFLLCGRTPLDVEEADKALVLGVQGLIPFQSPEDLAQGLRDLYSRWGAFETEAQPVYLWDEGQPKLGALFRHPRRHNLTPAWILRLKADGAVLRLYRRSDALDLDGDLTIKSLSLDTGRGLLATSARITSYAQGTLGVTWPTLSPDQLELLRPLLKH